MEKDLLFDEANAFAIKQERLSQAMLQQKFKIGYMRSGRLMDQLEESGVIAEFDGMKARKVIITTAKPLDAMENLIQEIDLILKGIDKTQDEESGGWWATSTGAAFGEKKLKRLHARIRAYRHLLKTP